MVLLSLAFPVEIKQTGKVQYWYQCNSILMVLSQRAFPAEIKPETELQLLLGTFKNKPVEYNIVTNETVWLFPAEIKPETELQLL